MKHLKLPKLKNNDSEYTFMGIAIPKINNANIPMILRRDRHDKNVSNKISPKLTTNNIKIVHNVDGVISNSADARDNQTTSTDSDVCDYRSRETSCSESGVKAGKESIATQDQFNDIVFSFFSGTDQTYVVNNARNSDGYVEINGQEPRCKSMGSGNEYEIMKPAITHYSSVVDLKSKDDEGVNNKTTLHKSELRFYVSASSLKEENNDSDGTQYSNNYDLPSNVAMVSKTNQSSYTIQNKSLNDVNNEANDDDTHKYQNSASLDNLSQVCNISLNNGQSKQSIASLPELESLDGQNNSKKDYANGPFAFSKITAAVTPKSSTRISDRSSYFNNNIKSIKIRNRLSAFYTAHKDFNGKKRLSKAWYGIKDWFDNEKMRMDDMIQKRSQKRVITRPSGEEYVDSEFSDYEDVDQSRESIDSFGKVEEFGDSSVVSGCSNRSGRRREHRDNMQDEVDSNYREIRSLSACNSSVRLTSIRDGDRYYISEENEREGAIMRHAKSQPSVLQISEPVLTKVNCEDVNGSIVESSLCEEDSSMFNRLNSISPDCRSSVKSDNCEEIMDPGVTTAQQNEQDNFAAMKSIVKEGSVMCKELITIFQQRAEAERQYCCGVLRVGARARRASKGASWAALASRRAAIDMEARAQLHRQFSNKLVEDIIRPMQRLVSSRDSIRKQVETDVGVISRRLTELRDNEGRCKKASHAAARYNERIQDTSVGRGATQGQEAELRRKKIKSEETANKTDIEYYMACVRAERARVELEIAVAKGLETLVELEEDRLSGMRKSLKVYVKLTALLGPGPPSEESKQLDTMLSGASKGEGRVARGLLNASPPPMHLPDFYCLHITLAMNKERRRQALMRILQLIKNDMERERKSKQALEKLSLAITATPNFGNNESQQNVTEKLYHMRSLLTYLEGARVQAAGALLALGGRQRPSHPLTPHINVQRDRRGLQQTLLQVPPWLRQELRPTKPSVRSPTQSPPGTPAPSSVARSSPPPSPGSSVAWTKDRGVADGVSVQHYSDVEEHIPDTPPARPPPPILPMIKKQHEFSV